MTGQTDGGAVEEKTPIFPETVRRYDTDRWLIVLRPRDGEYHVVRQRPATGAVRVAADARVELIFFPGQLADFSALAALQPDDSTCSRPNAPSSMTPLWHILER